MKNNDAYTQYNCEPFLNEEQKRVDNNFSFDLCRLGCSMFDFFIDDMDEVEEAEKDPIIKLIVSWCKDDNAKNILYKSDGSIRYPDFKLYKMIARNVHNHVPEKEIENDAFQEFVVTQDEEKPESSRYMDIDIINPNSE